MNRRGTLPVALKGNNIYKRVKNRYVYKSEKTPNKSAKYKQNAHNGESIK